MEPQLDPIVLFSPNHEQSRPSFHVEGDLVDQFVEYLEANEVEVVETSQELEKKGKDGSRLVEVSVESETPIEFLEELLRDFVEEEMD